MCGRVSYMSDPIPQNQIILSGLVGSRLYGMATPDSDYDRKGIYQAPLAQVLGLRKPEPTLTWSAPDPDLTLYELERFFTLALKSNPTAVELLFLPVYEQRTNAGLRLVSNRWMFLSSQARATYGGFAKSQQKRAKDTVRKPKAIRHMFRILEQGIELLTTGSINPVVADPERLMAYGEMDQESITPLVEATMERLRTCESVLPDAPDIDAVNDLLVSIRTTKGKW